MSTYSLVGKTLTCHETGKVFVGAVDGCSTNYAYDEEGHVYSDAGVDAREKRSLLDRSQPFVGYISHDGEHFTGWKGNVLGTVIWTKPIKLYRWSHVHGSTITAYRIRDVHGGIWYGRSSPGIAITLRPTKRGKPA